MTPGCHTLVALLIVFIATILLIDGFRSAPRNGSNRSSPAGVALLLGDRRTVFSATKARGAHSKRCYKSKTYGKCVAETVGFEPTIGFPL
jgi:hypothetical protein